VYKSVKVSELAVGDVVLETKRGMRGRVVSVTKPEPGAIGYGPQGGQYYLLPTDLHVKTSCGSWYAQQSQTVQIHIEEEW
jgi:hypothetical protein